MHACANALGPSISASCLEDLTASSYTASLSRDSLVSILQRMGDDSLSYDDPPLYGAEAILRQLDALGLASGVIEREPTESANCIITLENGAEFPFVIESELHDHDLFNNCSQVIDSIVIYALAERVRDTIRRALRVSGYASAPPAQISDIARVIFLQDARSVAGVEFLRIEIDNGANYDQHLDLGEEFEIVELLGEQGPAEGAFELGAEYSVFIDRASNEIAWAQRVYPTSTGNDEPIATVGVFGDSGVRGRLVDQIRQGEIQDHDNLLILHPDQEGNWFIELTPDSTVRLSNRFIENETVRLSTLILNMSQAPDAYLPLEFRGLRSQ